MVWKILLCILFGYLIGGINPSYIIGRIRGFDIRKKGSGNAGASNAMILMGKAVGAFSAIFDIGKATGAFFLAPLLFRDLSLASEIAAVACILGHMFPAYMKFRGGKGLACLGGLLIAIDWRLFLILFALELVLCLLCDYICVVPITASIIIPVLYGLLGSAGTGWLLFADDGWPGALVLAVASIGILARHVENIIRIFKKQELHLSYLWSKDKDAELARIGKSRRDGVEPAEPTDTTDPTDPQGVTSHIHPNTGSKEEIQ